MKPVLALTCLACVVSIAAACSAKPAAPPAPATAPAPAKGADASGAGGSSDLSAVPAGFIGEWNSDPKDCGKGHGEGSLTIEAHRIFFYESGGPIDAVTQKAPNLIQIAAKLTGEGETWTDVTTFRLSADGKTLTDASVPGEASPMTRTRCPKG